MKVIIINLEALAMAVGYATAVSESRKPEDLST